MGQTTSSGISGGINSTVGTQCPSSSSSRRESTMSCDSGYYLSLPSSRRASSLSDPISRRDSTMSECENMSSFILPHDGGCGGGGVGGSGGGVNISCIGPITTTSCVGPGSTAISRRDSSMSNDSGSSSFLSVESARQPGSVSSGCPSDGSTDSLVEQDLRNLSLSVTEKLWNE